MYADRGNFGDRALIGRLMIVASLLLMTAQAVAPTPTEVCELHIWPTAKYGALFFGVSNVRMGAVGTELDLALTPREQAAAKLRTAITAEQQLASLKTAIQNAGKFANYTIIAHEPMTGDRAKAYHNFLDKDFGKGARDTASKSACYAEMHVIYLTAYRTTLSKKLMTGFVLRRFPTDPAAPTMRVDVSNANRGKEQIGISQFAFSEPEISDGERKELSASLTAMAVKFMTRIK